MSHLRLAQFESNFIQGMSASDRARRLTPKLIELAEEIDLLAKAAPTEAGRELWELEALHVRNAADLLRVLEQEQWRQREAAKLFLCGQIDRSALRSITESWNNDPS